MAAFRSTGLHGYSVKFSPFKADKLALVACENYGIEGNGCLMILHASNGGCKPVQVYQWPDGLFDVTWSETNENICATAGGDGGMQLWNLTTPNVPVGVLKDHEREIYTIDWGGANSQHLIVTGSWDQTCRVWDTSQGQQRSIGTYAGHSGIVYCTVWSPHLPNTFASVSGDCTLRIWDTRKTYMPQHVVPGHDAEILSCDWSKYDSNVIVTGSVDTALRVWDLRNTKMYVRQLNGHNYAVRRIRCSPHTATHVVSCAYDFTVRTWDFGTPKETNPLLEIINHHTEFVYGLDMSLHVKGLIADCSWDETLKLSTPKSLLQSPTTTTTV